MTRLGRALVFGLPLGWLALFFLAPLAIVVRISLSGQANARPPYRPVLEWTLDPARWRAFLDGLGVESYRVLLSDPLYRDAGLSSLALAALSTALIGFAGFPLALALARAAPARRSVLLALVIVPFWTSFLIRVYAWIAILKPDGWLNAVLLGIGLGPWTILDTNGAVVIGMVYAYLPFMVLPVMASLDRQDPTLTQAAGDLGASPLVVFWTVTFPLALPGLTAGALLCFIPMVGEFVVPELLGGSQTLVLGRTLWSEFFSNRDWPLAAAVAVVMLALLVPPIVLLRRVEARRLGGGS